MRILVLGWYYSSNMGDAVLCDCAAGLLRQHYPEAEVVIRDLAGRTGFPRRNAVDCRELDRLRLRQKLRFLATKLGWDKQLSHETWCLEQVRSRLASVTEGDWDLAVFAGGQLFMDDLCLYVAEAAAALDRRHIPILYNACGAGPSVSPALQKVLAQALTLPSVQLVSCRDSAEKINAICGKSLAVTTGDAALHTGSVYGLTRAPSQAVGLGVLYPQSISPKRTAAFWRRLIRELDARSIPWKFFTNGSEWDMAFARTLLDGRPEAVYLAPAPESPRELAQLLGSFRSLIGFRLHSHIIAASMGVPSVALVWDQKVRQFFGNLGCPERCMTVDASPRQVIDALRKAEAEGLSASALKALQASASETLLACADRVLKEKRR